MATFERMLLARKHVIIGEKYNVVRKIGGGSFGDIFLAINIHDGEVILGQKLFFQSMFFHTLRCLVDGAMYFGKFVLEDGGLGVYLVVFSSGRLI